MLFVILGGGDYIETRTLLRKIEHTGVWAEEESNGKNHALTRRRGARASAGAGVQATREREGRWEGDEHGLAAIGRDNGRRSNIGEEEEREMEEEDEGKGGRVILQKTRRKKPDLIFLGYSFCFVDLFYVYYIIFKIIFLFYFILIFFLIAFFIFIF